jgi:putative chitinase
VGEEFMRAVEFITESKTVEYEGLTLKISKNGHQLMVNALDDWGNKVLGQVRFNIGDDKELDPQDLAVDEKYQGQGIARVMYDYVKSLGYTIVRSWDQTDAGAGFWNKHRGEDVRIWEGVDDDTKDAVANTVIDFYQHVGKIHKDPIDDYVSTAKEMLGHVDDPTLKSKLVSIFRQAKENPYIQGGVVTTIGALLAGGVLSSAQKMGLSPSQTNLALQAILNTVIPTVVSRINGKSWSDTIKYTLASAGIGTGIAGIMEDDLEEDWKSALATGAMAGAMAMGANAKAPNMVQQIVEPGDTVYSIARQNNVNPLEIYKLNKMDRNTKLEIGQKVLVPDYSKPISKMPATVKPTLKQEPAKVAKPEPSLKDKIASILPKFSQDKEDEGVTLLTNNSDAEATLQTAAKAAGLKGSELAQFMAQTRHESWDFGEMEEIGSKKTFAQYEKPRMAKRLGNKVKGDGERFKGRGFIQLTGRDNYTRASQQIFGDDRLVKNPELASRLDVGAKIALWFWKNQVRPNVSNFNNTTEVVKAINANEPAKVVKQRHDKFKEYLAVL